MIFMIQTLMRMRIWCVSYWLQEYWKAYSSLKGEKAQLEKRSTINCSMFIFEEEEKMMVNHHHFCGSYDQVDDSVEM